MEAFIYPPAAAEGKLSSDLSTPSTTKLWYKEKVYPIFSSFAGKVVGRYVCETLVLSSHFWEGKISVVSGREKSRVVTNSSRMKTIDSSHTHTHIRRRAKRHSSALLKQRAQKTCEVGSVTPTARYTVRFLFWMISIFSFSFLNPWCWPACECVHIETFH